MAPRTLRPGGPRHAGARVLLAACLALLAGCAETQYTLRFGLEELGQDQVPRWPLPPEVPRYLYVGELSGDANFVAVAADNRSRAEKVFAWIVGLGLPQAAPRRLQRPQSVLVHGDGRILVTDVGQGAVFAFDEVNGELAVYDEVAVGERFASPVGIVEGPDRQLLVSDADRAVVVRLSADGQPLGLIGAGLLERPTGLARDPEAGLLYVADTQAHDLKVFDDEGLLIDVIGGRGERLGEFNYPTHLAFANGRLYVADTMNTRLQVFDRDGRVVRAFGERGLVVGNLVRPKGVAVDDEGNIYVVESMHDHLLVYDSSARLLLPIGGEGRAPGQFRLPSGVTVDRRNRVYVADTFNGRVAIFQFLGST